ncbi:AsmA family protein [Luteimonas lutimaris]|uniref:AsmA family protein n=1 Tax=Luteimonas lutimaris TaxID=698645 RepID=A0ABP7N1I1_9GAMM
MPQSPTPTAGRRARDAVTGYPWLTVLAAVVVALVVLALLWDWNWFKGPVERAVEARTGRSFEIAGDLDVDLGRVTTIRAGGLTLGNAEWSKQARMASADRLELQIRPFALLRGDIVVPQIRLDKPDVRLETGPEGGGNWDFGMAPGDGDPPRLQRIWIEDGHLQFVDAANGTDINVDVASRKPRKAGHAPPVEVEGGGKWSGNRFTLEGVAESPLELQQTDTPYRINLRAAAGATRAHARGTLVNPFRLRDFDLRMALSGKNLEDLYPLLGISLPPTPPYALDGRFIRDGNTWRYEGFEGKVGDSDLSGTASVETGGARPMLRAELVSRRLDFDDLAGFIGGAPQAGGGETTNPELQALAAKREANPKLLPDTPYQLEKLRAMDADVRLKAQRINAPSLPLDEMDAHLQLDNGLLRLDPLDFGVAGGDIRATIQMDAREKTIRTRADIKASGLNLGELFPDAKLTDDAIGKLGGHVAITGTGNSIAQMLGSADGDIVLGMGRGQVSNLLMELAGIDIYESLKFLIGKDHKVPIRCAFGDFGVKDGLMTSRALAFDTTDTIIVGEGTVNLRDETLDLLLKPRPKDRSILTLRSPLVVDGTFKNPSFRPDLKRLGLRGAIAVALGSIAPPAALLATIDLGGGEDSGCGGQYAK